MHWVIQNNLFSERAIETLLDLLTRYGIPHDSVKVIPFGGGILPEVSPDGPVVAIGSFSLARYAKSKGWTPGSWLGRNASEGIDDFSFQVCHSVFGEHMLNHGGMVLPFKDALNHDLDPFFIRPVDDGKSFSGTVMDRADFAEWQEKISAADSTWSITPETMVVVSPLREIISETRFVVVDGAVVTGSEYKRGGRVCYNSVVDPHILAYARHVALLWTPDRVCVMDIADTPEGPCIVEFNNFNSAGWYDCDVSKIIQAVEGLFDN